MYQLVKLTRELLKDYNQISLMYVNNFVHISIQSNKILKPYKISLLLKQYQPEDLLKVEIDKIVEEIKIHKPIGKVFHYTRVP